MKQLKFVVTVLLSAVFAVFVVTACNPQSPDTASSPAGSASPAAGGNGETLVMATSADYPPYEFIETASGSEEIVGFDVDIARYITEQLGYGLEINNIEFNALIPALQADRADFVMAGMTPTEERLQNADFSDIYYQATHTIVSKAGSNLTTPESLAGQQVGVQLGSIQEGIAKDIEGANVVPLNRINEIVQELKAGRIDAAIIEDKVAEGYVQSNPDLEYHPLEASGGSAIAFPKGSELVSEFNTVLQEMESNGTMEELVNKWFRSEEASEPSPAS
jgi:arginine/lysine/histidine transporter system substrate-binding protein